MYDLEFFLDPACPWCWITSRWVVEVQQLRGHTVGWRFIALEVLNEDRAGEYATSHRPSHVAGFAALRVLDAVRAEHGNDAVGRLYTALGTAIHTDGRSAEFVADPAAFIAQILPSAGLDIGVAAHAGDDSHDDALRAETAAALERTGPGVGTPIITLRPGTPSERSFFGPVIPRIPRGDEALRLWDAVGVLADSDVAEIKRSVRGTRTFA